MTAPCNEKIWTILGPEFGAGQGKKAKIVHVLYGLKSSGAVFHAHLVDCMQSVGYSQCKGNNNLWLKPEIDPDGKEYQSYILCHVDDVLLIHHDTMTSLMNIDKYFKLKPLSF